MSKNNCKHTLKTVTHFVYCHEEVMLLGNRNTFPTNRIVVREAVSGDGEGFRDLFPLLSTGVSSCSNTLVTTEARPQGNCHGGFAPGELPQVWKRALGTQTGELFEDLVMHKGRANTPQGLRK